MRVLVVEDSPRLQRTLGLALRKSGYAGWTLTAALDEGRLVFALTDPHAE